MKKFVSLFLAVTIFGSVLSMSAGAEEFMPTENAGPGSTVLQEEADSPSGTVSKDPSKEGETVLDAASETPEEVPAEGEPDAATEKAPPESPTGELIEEENDQAVVPDENISVETAVSAADLAVTSPDGSLSVGFELSEAGQLIYTVNKNGENVLESSRLGILTDQEDFSNGVEIKSTQVTSLDESYSLPQGKKSVYRNHYNEREIVLEKNGCVCKIYFRIFDDGVAYRYYLPGEGTATIYEERSEFNLPNNTGGWAFDWRNDYEGLYTYRSPSAFANADFALPVLASIKNNKYWMLLTEGNVYNASGSYCTSHLDGSAGEVMKVAFTPEQTSPITATYPVETPYRVAIITDNLNDLANSVLVTNLNPPAAMTDTSWIKTGKSAWSWWSEERSPQWFERQRDYVDFAAENGWEFVTVDAGWDDSWVAQLCKEAAAKNVDIVIWTDVGAIDTQQEVDEKLARWASWGVAGVKVDFMMNDSQMRMETYQLIAEKCAELHMLVNFHGSTKPGGEIRTWPHVTTTEAVRGSEHYKWSGYSTAYQNSTLPFTRNVIGPMDFTPTVISNSNLNTTHAHQLALAVIFESGMQHFADSIDSYEAWRGKNFLNKVPVTWDEMRVLDAFPGDYAVIARRKGSEWYLGAISNAARTITIDCSFLNGDHTAYIYKDSPDPNIMEVGSQPVNSSSTLTLDLASAGGCAILFTNEPYSITLEDDPRYVYYEAESTQNTLTGQASRVVDANCFGGQKIGNLGGARKSSVTFRGLSAAGAGTYEVKLYYASGEPRNISYWVNDGEEQVLELPGTGSYHTLRCARFYVDFNDGANALKFGGTAYAPDVDRIAIRAFDPASYTAVEAESGTLSGQARVANSANFSGGKKVSYVGLDGELTLSNIKTAADGTYLLRIYYGTGDNRTVMVSANGSAPVSAICFDSGGFDTVEYKEILLSLAAGSNTLRFYNPDGYAPDIDRVEIAARPIE